MSKLCKGCGTELIDSAKFCSKCGSKCEELYQGNEVNLSLENNVEVLPDKSKKKKQILAIIVGILAVCILLVSVFGGSSRVTFSEFINTYNKLSQKEFDNNGITGWDEIELDDMQEVQAEATLFKNSSDVTTYGYLYQGMVSNPGVFMVYIDEDDSVLGYSFIMSVEYIAGNDDFHNIVLESLMKAFDDLSKDEIYKIKSNFSMQDSLIGAVTRSNFGKYEYNGILYVVTQTEDGLTFSAYLADERAETEKNNVEEKLEADGQNEEQNQDKEKDFSIIEGTWRQSSICYPGAADISEIGGGEIIISKMNGKEIDFTIRDYSGNPDYKVQEYKVTDYEITEEYGEYIITFTAEKGMRGTLTITELTGKEKTLELAIHSEEETYTRGTGFYNKVSSDVEVKETVKSERAETKEDTEVKSNDVDAMDELLCLVGVEKHWSGFGSENGYEEHMETVLKPWVMKLTEEHNFYPGTTMIRISEYDRKERIYFVMIYDDLNSGNYAGFYANLNTDEVTFSQGDSNVVIQ